MQIARKVFPVISIFHDLGNSKSAFSPRKRKKGAENHGYTTTILGSF